MPTRIGSPDLTSAAAAGQIDPAAGKSAPSSCGEPTPPTEVDAALNPLKNERAPRTPPANPNTLRRARLEPRMSPLAATAATSTGKALSASINEGHTPVELECAHVALLGTTNEVASNLASHLEGLRHRVENGLDHAQFRHFELDADLAMEQILTAHQGNAIDKEQCHTLIDFLSALRHLANQ